MRDRPGGAELLAEARRLLREELVPTLAGAQRYQALMIANALGMAERELLAGERPLEAERAALSRLLSREGSQAALTATLAAALRDGRLAGDPEAYVLLLEETRSRLAESNPRALEEG
ncbi:MAG: DUF6285 domain-containing protein [Tistlia sp.]